MIKLEQVI